MIFQLFTEPHHFFYHKSFGSTHFYVRSMQLETDLPLVHEWVNAPYAHRFWKMQGSIAELAAYYNKQQQEQITSTFFVCDGTMPIAIFDVYQVIWTALRCCYDARQSDYGIHLLMAPPRQLARLQKEVGKVSEKVLNTIIEMLFSFTSVERVMAEPDIKNTNAHQLAEKAGFIFQKEIQLPNKMAKLYMITKNQFAEDQLTQIR